MPLEYLKEINSTNLFIEENIKDYNSDFSGVYTFNQTKGKGVRGNCWLSEPGKNIALSFCLNGNNLSNHFTDISFWVAIVMHDFTYKIANCIPTYIKWPNDIIVKGKKICGILIEKHKGIYVIGVGLNVFQEHFGGSCSAISLSSLNIEKQYNLHKLVADLILKFRNNYQLLKDSSKLLERYNEYLLGRNTLNYFFIEEKKIKGIIKEVDKNGLLVVDIGNEIKKFRMKEIRLIL